MSGPSPTRARAAFRSPGRRDSLAHSFPFSVNKALS